MQEYFVHLIVDNLPVATQFKMPDSGELQYEPGYRLGSLNQQQAAFINNHLRFILSYHVLDEDPSQKVYRVVGFRVETASIAADGYEAADAGAGDVCKIKDKHEPQDVKKDAASSVQVRARLRDHLHLAFLPCVFCPAMQKRK